MPSAAGLVAVLMLLVEQIGDVLARVKTVFGL